MSSKGLGETLRETLSLFDGSGAPRTTTEVAERLDIGRRSTYERLQRLVEHGHLETKDVGASARVWWRPPGPDERRTDADPPGVSGSFVERILDGIGAGAVVTDDRGVVQWVNGPAARYLGLDPDRVRGRERASLVDEGIAPAVDDPEAITEVLLADEGESGPVDCRITAGEDGAERRLTVRSLSIESGTYAGGRVDLFEAIADGTRGDRDERAQFESLVEATEEYAIFLLDPDGYVRTWNPGAERIKGYDAADIVGEHFSTFYTDEDRAERIPGANLRTAAEHGSVEDEGWRVRADGSRFWANVTITALRDDDGDIEGFAKVTRDMTDRREREQRLRKEKAFSESMLESQRDIVYAFDTEGRSLRWNDRLLEVTGYTDGQVEEMTALDFVTGESVDRAAEAMQRVLGDGESTTVEVQVETADGETIPYQFSGSPLTDPDGEVVGFTGVGRDITERKEKERRLRRQRDDLEAELDTVFDRIGDAFCGLDERLRFTYANDDAEDLLGHTQERLIGKRFPDVLPSASEAADTAIREAMDQQKQTTFEVQFDSSDRWAEANVYPSADGISVYLRDVTERKRREQELERYETIVETVDDGLYAVDDDGRITLVNEAFCEMLGYDRSEIVGMSADAFLGGEFSPAVEEQIAAVKAGERDVATVELELERNDGSTVPVETRFKPYPVDGGIGNCGVARNVTERRERERELQRRVRQQEVVTGLGQQALEAHDVDALMADAAAAVAETLGNDYCKVLDLDAEAEELLLRQGVGWDEGIVGEATVSSVEDDSQAAYTLATDEPVVVEDLTTESRFSGPDLLRDHDVRSGISAVIGSPDAPWGILGTHDTERREFSDRDVNFVQSVANILGTAIDRHRGEQQLMRQREHLAAMVNLNDVVREITDAVIEQSTREEIETTVCERLAATDSYEFAWIGDIESGSRAVTARAEAGAADYLDDVEITAHTDDERGLGPTGRALRTGEVQTIRDMQGDPHYEPWAETAERHGIRSSAAIPLVHGETVYGVLNVYADRTNAFDGEERAVVAQLGEVVGHAIAAVERKRALMSDEVIEIDFRIQRVFETLDFPDAADGRIALNDTVPLSDDEFLVYGTATPDAVETVTALVDQLPHWDEVTFHDEEGDPRKFELRLTDPPILSTVAALGGAVDSAVIEDGDYRMSIRLSPGADVRRLIDAVETVYPSVEMVRRQQVSRTRAEPEGVQRLFAEDLTDRQRTTLEAAYHAGFFEWPRDTSGEDVADSMGVSPPTFHQHLRKAQKKVFDSLLSREGTAG